MAQRIESGRLKLESQQLELDKSRGAVIETVEANRAMSDVITTMRQAVMQVPGASKTTLGLSNAQAVGLQRAIREALTQTQEKELRRTRKATREAGRRLAREAAES